MLIKIISNQPLRSNVTRREFIVEASQYRLQKMDFDNQEDMWSYLKDYGDFYSPFNLDVNRDAREVMVLEVIEPAHSVIIATGCHVFVMNQKGKTIDRFSIASNLPQTSK